MIFSDSTCSGVSKTSYGFECEVNCFAFNFLTQLTYVMNLNTKKDNLNRPGPVRKLNEKHFRLRPFLENNFLKKLKKKKKFSRNSREIQEKKSKFKLVFFILLVF
jgi:hypothetical protein